MPYFTYFRYVKILFNLLLFSKLLGVTVIVLENGHDKPSSNAGQGYVSLLW